MLKTKLDVREFSNKEISNEIILKILEAARLSNTILNAQHWRFILVKDIDNLTRLVEESTSGKGVKNAAFAVRIITQPKYQFHLIDAGRVL